MKRTPKLPPGWKFRTPPLGNLEEDDEQYEELGTVLVTLGLFASPTFAESVVQEFTGGRTSVETIAALAMEEFPGALGYIAMLTRIPR